MSVTIIPCDGMVAKDGVVYAPLDLSSAGIPETVHALQWQGTSGWIEHTDLTNELITTLPDWAGACLSIWQAASDEASTLPTPEETHAQIQAQRQAAYITEADPLFFKAQRGEATMAEWSSKVEEIRNRFPYPVENRESNT